MGYIFETRRFLPAFSAFLFPVPEANSGLSCPALKIFLFFSWHISCTTTKHRCDQIHREWNPPPIPFHDPPVWLCFPSLHRHWQAVSICLKRGGVMRLPSPLFSERTFLTGINSSVGNPVEKSVHLLPKASETALFNPFARISCNYILINDIILVRNYQGIQGGCGGPGRASAETVFLCRQEFLP